MWAVLALVQTTPILFFGKRAIRNIESGETRVSIPTTLSVGNPNLLIVSVI